MKNRLSFLVPVLIAAGLALSGCTGKNHESENAKPEEQTAGHSVITLTAASITEVGLTTTVVVAAPLVGTMTIPAKLLPNQNLEAQVGSLVQGRVKEVFATVGDVVRKDQPLMNIEGLDVGAVKSGFIKARAQLKYEEANYQRQKALFDQKVGSQRAFLEAKANYDKALAEFTAEDKRIHSIGLSDEDVQASAGDAADDVSTHSGGVLPVKAPIAGVVVERNVVIGQLVDASTTAFRIINTASLWADGQVYERDSPRIVGSPEVSLTVTAFPSREFRGKLIYVAPVVDERTRTITVRASIPNPAGLLKPQMFGELHIPVGGREEGLVIPAESVQQDHDSSYVFVALNDTTFAYRTVRPGAVFDSMVEVKEGLVAGERVVVKGSFQLKSELRKEALGGEE